MVCRDYKRNNQRYNFKNNIVSNNLRNINYNSFSPLESLNDENNDSKFSRINNPKQQKVWKEKQT